jgi:hypothetical protein
MRLTVVDRTPRCTSVDCDVALLLRRSREAGRCCCCRDDHAPDVYVDPRMEVRAS